MTENNSSWPSRSPAARRQCEESDLAALEQLILALTRYTKFNSKANQTSAASIISTSQTNVRSHTLQVAAANFTYFFEREGGS